MVSLLPGDGLEWAEAGGGQVLGLHNYNPLLFLHKGKIKGPLCRALQGRKVCHLVSGKEELVYLETVSVRFCFVVGHFPLGTQCPCVALQRVSNPNHVLGKQSD